MPTKNPAAVDINQRPLVQWLESFQRAGITHLAATATTIEAAAAALAIPQPEVEANQIGTPPAAQEAPRHPSSLIPHLSSPISPPAAQDDPRRATLAALAEQVAGCARCKELAATRTQTVFGVGNPYARLVFCGEAPGADEDRQGEPFVGRAGQLLNDIIVKGMKMRREDVYILNILRCRPPENRTPLPAEAAACREFLDKQLAIIQPEFICCLGACAAQNLLGTTATIGRLRGKVHDYQGIKVVCTYHPAYVLRNPQAKKPVWDDIQMLMAEMAKSEAPG
jgi:uracil-DNA glycosylase